jgi:hypothetical protein
VRGPGVNCYSVGAWQEIAVWVQCVVAVCSALMSDTAVLTAETGLLRVTGTLLYSQGYSQPKKVSEPGLCSSRPGRE